MRETTPEVFLIARPSLDWDEINRYLTAIGGQSWQKRMQEANSTMSGEALVEFMGRACYRSWEPGLNANVTRIRADSAGYLKNILASAHGSVLEHANYTFVFHNVSRVFTHELVRHRAGVAISQESLRYVRLTDLPFAHPDFVLADPELKARADGLIADMEHFQELIVTATDLDNQDFHVKKQITSAARRYAPDGLSTMIAWTANVRALRHILAIRTSSAAEAEIRLVFDQVGQLMVKELPALFGDFKRSDDGTWTPEFEKV